MPARYSASVFGSKSTSSRASLWPALLLHPVTGCCCRCWMGVRRCRRLTNGCATWRSAWRATSSGRAPSSISSLVWPRTQRCCSKWSQWRRPAVCSGWEAREMVRTGAPGGRPAAAAVAAGAATLDAVVNEDSQRPFITPSRAVSLPPHPLGVCGGRRRRSEEAAGHGGRGAGAPGGKSRPDRSVPTAAQLPDRCRRRR